MIRKIVIAAIAAIFLLTSVGLASAMDLGNKRKGKYTYRKVYQACHQRGAVESKTPFLSPADKTQAEWEAIYNSGDFSIFKCEDEWNALSETEVLDILSYLYSYASDSPTPAKCK